MAALSAALAVSVLAFKFDDLAALMLFVVSFVASLSTSSASATCVTMPRRRASFGGLSVFMFSMCGIVLADNLFMILSSGSLSASAPTC